MFAPAQASCARLGLMSLLGLLPFVVLALEAPRTAAEDFQGSHHIVAYDDAPWSYSKTEATDPVARLADLLEHPGKAPAPSASPAPPGPLDFEEPHGYLKSLLHALDIPVSSQLLVGSKTSLHRDLISPASPRAIYFNDDVYVGWVRWAPVIEISAADPHRGGMFYVLPQNPSVPPRIVRNHTCIECHVSRFSMGVPGHLIRSVETAKDGTTGDITGGVRVSHDTPVEERRNGWYVTGDPGGDTHLGNRFGAEGRGESEADGDGNARVEDLADFLDVGQYLTPHSDLVAMMVLEHQVHMHNFIARLHYESSLRLHQYGHVRYVHKIADSFLQYLLFTKEASLRGPVKGTSAFAREFEKRGPFDDQGRSLRQFDLENRLFKFPCSYLIYSDAFDQLPDLIKDYLYRRLWEILNDKDLSGDFDNIPHREAVLEILRHTKSGLPDYWRAGADRTSHHSTQATP